MDNPGIDQKYTSNGAETDVESLGLEGAYSSDGGAGLGQPHTPVTEKPEFYLSAAFVGGFLLARLLRRAGRRGGD